MKWSFEYEIQKKYWWLVDHENKRVVRTSTRQDVFKLMNSYNSLFAEIARLKEILNANNISY